MAWDASFGFGLEDEFRGKLRTSGNPVRNVLLTGADRVGETALLPVKAGQGECALKRGLGHERNAYNRSVTITTLL